MRVLHVIPGLGARTGGPAVAVVELATALRRLGVDAPVISTDQVASAGSPSGITVADMPPGAAELDIRLAAVRPPRRLAYSPELVRLVSDEVARADVVHVHSLFLHAQFAAGRLARRAGRPYVVSFRGALDPALAVRGRARKALTELLWQRRMLGRAAAFHVTSAAEERLTAHVAPHVARHVIPNIVPLPDRLPEPAPVDGLDPSRPIVTFLSRVAAKKRVEVLVDALAEAPLRDRGAQLAIVGPDEEGLTPALRRRAEERGVAGDVCFAGMLTGDAKWAMLRASSAWALPSIGENFGIAAAEALAAGVPVVMTPEVNLSQDVAAAGAGLVAAGTPAAFAEALARVLDDPAAARAMGERGRELAARYRADVVGPQVVAMYEAVIGGR